MIETRFEAFTLLTVRSVIDGIGAQQSSFEDDLPFRGLLTFTTAARLSAGGQPMLEETPTLLYDPDVTLSPGTPIRREKDGAIYRVCGSSLGAPAYSGLRFLQVKVERQVCPC